MYRTYNSRPIPGRAPARRTGWPFLAALFIVLGAYVLFTLVRPLAPLQVTVTPPVMPGLVRVKIPWPAAAPNQQAALGADGYGLLASKGPETPIPMASVTKTITALSVLQKKPLKPGEQGPGITMTAADVVTYNEYVAKDGTVVPVYPGQTVTQYQALQALMLPSANNIADKLAVWAFGSMEAYLEYANALVKSLDMKQTTVSDASGFNPKTVSTATDLVRLGDAALDNPVLAEIVSQPTAEYPEAGTIRNVNKLLGQSGIRGIKTGNTEEAGGCLLAAADVPLTGSGGKTIRVITAVMASPDPAQAMRGTLPMIQSAPSQFQTVKAVRDGQNLGKVTSEWGESVAIEAADDMSVTTWTGTAITPHASKVSVKAPAKAGEAIGTISLKLNGKEQKTDIVLAAAIERPSLWWRLTHPF